MLRPKLLKLSQTTLELQELLLKLRYGSSNAKLSQKPKLSLKAISKLTQLTTTTLLRYYSQIATASSLSSLRQPGRPAKLTEAHISYLIDPTILQIWASYSLKERAQLFHRSFPELRISSSTIAKLYRQHGIKYKAIVRIKPSADMNQLRLR